MKTNSLVLNPSNLDLEEKFEKKFESLEQKLDMVASMLLRKETPKEDEKEGFGEDFERRSTLKGRRKVQNEVLENFDFSKVEKVMKQLDWIWSRTNCSVPTAEEIKEYAEKLFNDVWKSLDEKEWSNNWTREETISTGGLEVYVQEEYKPDKCKTEQFASLKFVLTDNYAMTDE